MRDPKRVAILISGRGSNMRALIEWARDYEVVLVASNKPHAAGLDWARGRGIPTWTWDSKGVDREDFDRVLGDTLDDHNVGTIALAGYMRILSPAFVERFAGRIVNIHPSLLPKYPGLDTHQRALDAGDKDVGCTVHVVTDQLDSGEILGQAQIPVHDGETAESLEKRVLAAEHKLYPRILRQFVKR